MDPLPFRHQPGLFGRNFTHDASKVGPCNPDAVDQFRSTVSAKQVDLRLSGPCDVNMCRLMILRVDHEAEAESAMDNDHNRL
jgi:hypothetical protein